MVTIYLRWPIGGGYFMWSTKTMTVPSVILVFSGKRKSGKDFITDLLQDRYYHELFTNFLSVVRKRCTC